MTAALSVFGPDQKATESSDRARMGSMACLLALLTVGFSEKTALLVAAVFGEAAPALAVSAYLVRPSAAMAFLAIRRAGGV
jgi:hypothetical protein